MSYFDIFISILLVLAIIKGYKNGFVIELASLLALVLGVLGAILLTTWIEAFLKQWWAFKYLNIIIFLITFIGIIIGTHMLAKTIDEMIKKAVLNVLNRIAGAIFSFFKYAFIFSVLLSVMQSFNWDAKILPPSEKAKSILYTPLSKFAPSMFPYLEFKGTLPKIEGFDL